jgi:hypothetical protein
VRAPAALARTMLVALDATPGTRQAWKDTRHA